MDRLSFPMNRLRTAIVVDDSRAMRAILRQALERRAFRVVEASDGRQALAVLAEGGAQALALIDWNMPVMDGLELIVALRADPAYTEMHIVMVTSESEPAQIQRALAAGADEYIMKPISSETLIDRLIQLERAVLR